MTKPRFEIIEEEKIPNNSRRFEIIKDQEAENTREQPQPEVSLWEKIKEFMNPQTDVDSRGNSKVDTILGKMPKDDPEYNFGTSENQDFLKNLIEGFSGSPGIKTVLQAPFKLTLKNIAKNIIESKNTETLFHSNEYEKIWNAAKNIGLDKVHIDPKAINFDAIRNFTTKKYHGALGKFLENPTLENAQKAQSDLGKFINTINSGSGTITSETKLALNEAEKAQKYIKDKMFRNKNGEVNQSLKETYDKVSASYGKNFKPYDIPAINKYEKGKLTAKQLMQKLKSSEFMATKGAAHPEIERRDTALQGLKYLGIPTGAGLGFYGVDFLIKKLLGKND